MCGLRPRYRPGDAPTPFSPTKQPHLSLGNPHTRCIARLSSSSAIIVGGLVPWSSRKRRNHADFIHHQQRRVVGAKIGVMLEGLFRAFLGARMGAMPTRLKCFAQDGCHANTPEVLCAFYGDVQHRGCRASERTLLEFALPVGAIDAQNCLRYRSSTDSCPLDICVNEKRLCYPGNTLQPLDFTQDPQRTPLRPGGWEYSGY
jgi:hypothetical protein